MKTNSRRGNKMVGTTLLEIVITMAIMSFGMLGFFSLQIRAMQVSKSAVLLSQATSIAAAIQDSLLAQPFSETSSTSASSGGGEEGAEKPPLEVCTSSPADELADLCRPLAPVNRAGNTNTSLGATVFNPSYEITDLGAGQKRIRVRVRFPAEEATCPDCSSERARGFKAVTFTTVRTATAY